MDDLLDKYREARHGAPVLKTKLLSIRSSNKNAIAVFEGKTDVGVYECWIMRANEDLKYRPAPASGKKQILAYLEACKKDASYPSKNIYFFIDRDFDLLGVERIGNNVFLTEGYSLENQLVGDQVIASLLKDEFGLHYDEPLMERIQRCFSVDTDSFLEAILPINKLLYHATTNQLERVSIEKRIRKYVNISYGNISQKFSDVSDLVVFKSEIDMKNLDVPVAIEDRLLTDKNACRGKFLHQFMLAWLEDLAQRQRAGDHPFEKAMHSDFNRGGITERSLASRSELPLGLKSFILRISGVDSSVEPSH